MSVVTQWQGYISLQSLHQCLLQAENTGYMLISLMGRHKSGLEKTLQVEVNCGEHISF